LTKDEDLCSTCSAALFSPSPCRLQYSRPACRLGAIVSPSLASLSICTLSSLPPFFLPCFLASLYPCLLASSPPCFLATLHPYLQLQLILAASLHPFILLSLPLAPFPPCLRASVHPCILASLPKMSLLPDGSCQKAEVLWCDW
jgi:hypothetical protein